jgi:hypothetical protein
VRPQVPVGGVAQPGFVMTAPDSPTDTSRGTKRDLALKIILLLEEDRPPASHKSFKNVRSNLRKAIKQRLRYLGVPFNLHDLADIAESSYDWTVT